MMIRDQAPSGGCVYCGDPVRTRKGGDWVCSECYRYEMGQSRHVSLEEESGTVLHRRVVHPTREYIPFCASCGRIALPGSGVVLYTYRIEPAYGPCKLPYAEVEPLCNLTCYRDLHETRR